MGFRMAYISLLQAIADNDTAAIGSICEKTLYREFQSGLQDLNFTYKQISVLNLAENMEYNFQNIDLQVIHTDGHFGS